MILRIVEHAHGLALNAGAYKGLARHRHNPKRRHENRVMISLISLSFHFKKTNLVAV